MSNVTKKCLHLHVSSFNVMCTLVFKQSLQMQIDRFVQLRYKSLHNPSNENGLFCFLLLLRISDAIMIRAIHSQAESHLRKLICRTNRETEFTYYRSVCSKCLFSPFPMTKLQHNSNSVNLTKLIVFKSIIEQKNTKCLAIF